MKKFLNTLLLSLLLCNSVFADVQQELIEKYLLNRKLDSIEGIWGNKYNSNLVVYYKVGEEFRYVAIEDNSIRCGAYHVVKQIEENFYTSSRLAYKGEKRGKRKNCKTVKDLTNYTFLVDNNTMSVTQSVQGYKPIKFQCFRIWPTN